MDEFGEEADGKDVMPGIARYEAESMTCGTGGKDDEKVADQLNDDDAKGESGAETNLEDETKTVVDEEMRKEGEDIDDEDRNSVGVSQHEGKAGTEAEKPKGKDRGKRFVDTGNKSEFFKSKTLNELRPFYNGSSLDFRMTEIRKSIYYIRKNWQDFDTFLVSLKELMLKDGDLGFEDEEVQQYADRLLTIKRNWMKHFEIAFLDISYDAIKMYTSSEGYGRMYRLSNEIFRREDSIDTTELIQNVTFLVELINIDLYNYCLKKPHVKNFEGNVYRGMCLGDDDIEAFKSLRKEPINRRNIAVPLGLFSGSSSLDIALAFIEEGLEHRQVGKPRRKPLLIKINVIGLKPEYIAEYRRRFPNSVLTTICAVDVHDLSVFPDEFEVLLRGPFLQILDVYQDCNLLDEPCDVLEAVMLNANRDHISVVHLGDQDTPARDMFATMVAVTRSEFAVKYCEDNGLVQDAWEYQKIWIDSLMKLETLLKDDDSK